MWRSMVRKGFETCSVQLGPTGTLFARSHFRAQKSHDFQVTPLPMPLIMDVARHINNRYINSYYSSGSDLKKTPVPTFDKLRFLFLIQTVTSTVFKIILEKILPFTF